MSPLPASRRRLLALLSSAWACAPAPEAPALPPAQPQAEVRLALSGIDGGVLDVAHTCHGRGASPALSWEASSPEASSAAWLLETQAADGSRRVHWFAWNPEGSSVPAALHPASTPPVQSYEDGAAFGYAAPCPDEGEVLEGRLLLWVLSRHLSVPPTASREAVMAEIGARVQGRAQVDFEVRAPEAEPPPPADEAAP